jgi:hypothetical protein
MSWHFALSMRAWFSRRLALSSPPGQGSCLTPTSPGRTPISTQTRWGKRKIDAASWIENHADQIAQVKHYRQLEFQQPTRREQEWIAALWRREANELGSEYLGEPPFEGTWNDEIPIGDGLNIEQLLYGASDDHYDGDPPRVALSNRLTLVGNTTAASERCCEGCYRLFEPTRSWNRFCEDSCQAKAGKRRQRARRKQLEEPSQSRRAA